MNDITVRPFQPDDLPALVGVAARAAAEDDAESVVTAADLEHEFNLPNIRRDKDVFVATLPDGQIVGYVVTTLFYPLDGFALGSGTVDPAYRRRGIGTKLLRAAKARIVERAAAEVNPDSPLYIRRSTNDNVYGAMALFEAEGYRAARKYLEMRITLDKPMSAVSLEDGITLRPFDVERDAYAAYQADNEFFRNTWGFVEIPFDDWRSHFIDHPHFDPDLWLLAYEGDALAAMTFGYPVAPATSDASPDMIYIDVLGVKSPWRKRGLGMALLTQQFQRIREKGYSRAKLIVDSENPTNAVNLYKRAGMSLYRSSISYRKDLRGTGH